MHNIFYEILRKKRTLSFKTYADAEKRVIKKQFDVIVYYENSKVYTSNSYSYYDTGTILKYSGFYINPITKSLECYSVKRDFLNFKFSTTINIIEVSGQTPQPIKYGKVHEYFKNSFIKNFVNTTQKEFEEAISEEVFQNKLIESISEDIKAGFIYPYELKISEFPEMVYETEHHLKSGTLASSCMRVGSSHNCRLHSKAYNGICKILYAQDDKNLLLGRALIWENCIDASNLSKYIETKENLTPVTFLDRPYGDTAFQLAALNYAIQQGWKYRSFESSQIYQPNGNAINFIFKHCPKLPNYLINKGTPYFDTLRCFNPTYKLITNQSLHTKQLEKLIDIGNASGSRLESKYFYTYICSKCDEGYELEGNELGHQYKVCKSCADRYLKTCDCCGTVGTSLRYDARLKIAYCDDKCLNSLGYISCSNCGDNIKISDAEGIMLDTNPYVMCNKCVESFNKCKICNNYTTDEDHMCRGCKKFMSICSCCDNLHVVHNYNHICSNCTNAYTKSYETYQFYLDIENLE